MTNDELKALCDEAIIYARANAKLGAFNLELLATECLRLLAQCEAMRGVVDASIAIVQAHYIDATCKDCTGDTSHINQLLDKIEQLQKLPEFNSQLGERT